MARDPKRINKILSTLKTYWKCNPDMRLGQILHNMSVDLNIDIFFLEDDDLKKALDKWMIEKLNDKT